MMVQLQIPLANRSVQEESWKVKLAERLSGRKLGDFGEPEDIAETAAFLSSSRYIIDKFDIRILSWYLPWSLSHSLTHSVHNFFTKRKGKHPC